jgi:hypothetical protein
MSLEQIQQQIQALQQQAESLRLDDHNQPAAWRKRMAGQGWYRYLELPAHQHELFRADGWEPLHKRQQAMDDAKARALAREHRGVALVRAVEAGHGIH